MPVERNYVGPFSDSLRWQKFKPRPDDIVVCTAAKSGTTWMQTIVSLLLSGDPDLEPEISMTCPWIDIRFRDVDEVMARLEAQTHRRAVKTHTPFDGIPYYPDLTYIAVFRHPLDVHFSMRNHVRNIPLPHIDWYYPEDDEALTFKRFLECHAEGSDFDANPLAAIVHYYRTFKDASDRYDNVHLFHYADMCRDLAAEMARVAAILGVSHGDDLMAALVKTATFESMSAAPERFAPSGGMGFWKSDEAFFDGGNCGKWQGKLSEDQLAAYDARISEMLSPEDRHWLEFGSA